MTITVEMPEGLLDQLVPAGQDPVRAALEAIAIEGYRSGRLTEADIRGLLGFETPMELDGFLKKHLLSCPTPMKISNMIVKWRVRSHIGLGQSGAGNCPASGAPDDRHHRRQLDRLPDSQWRDGRTRVPDTSPSR